MRLAFALLSLALLAPGCGSKDPAYIAGQYLFDVTNGTNGCGFPSWTENVTTQNIPATITQAEGSTEATAQVDGIVGALIDLVVGTRVFTGSVEGNEFRLTLIGTRALTQGMCTYTISSELAGEIHGNTLEGTIIYTAHTNQHSDCGTLQGCRSVQTFVGTRAQAPPTADAGVSDAP